MGVRDALRKAAGLIVELPPEAETPKRLTKTIYDQPPMQIKHRIGPAQPALLSRRRGRVRT